MYEDQRTARECYLASLKIKLMLRSRNKGSVDEAKLLEEEVWVLHLDGASNKKGDGAGIVLKRLGRFRVEQALMFKFKTSNNQVEYEALITGLLLARDM